MTELQQSRYDQLLRRLGDLKGPGSKVNDVLQELFPTVDVESVPGELLALMGTRLCIGAATVTGSAGQSARIQVFNPLGSGMIAAVSSVLMTGTGTQNFRYAISNTALTTGVGTEVFRDGRFGVVPRPVCQIRTDDTVALTDAHGLIRLVPSVTYTLEDLNTVAVLPPGSGFEVGSSAFATLISVTFNWRERVAEPSELNF